MIVIDHWNCASCSDSFADTPPRNIDELVRVPTCPRCGSARVRIEIASISGPNGQNPGGRGRGKPRPATHASYAAREKNRTWKVIIGR